MNNCAEHCWEARESEDQELTPRISSTEVTDGLYVSGFQGMVGLGETGRGKAEKVGIDNTFGHFAAKGSWEIGQ